MKLKFKLWDKELTEHEQKLMNIVLFIFMNFVIGCGLIRVGAPPLLPYIPFALSIFTVSYYHKALLAQLEYESIPYEAQTKKDND